MRHLPRHLRFVLPAAIVYCYAAGCNNPGDDVGVTVAAVTIASPTTLTIAPAADAHVRDGSSASSNFGASTTLEVRNQSGSNRISYLRFPLTAINGTVTAAKLRLFGKRATSSTVRDGAFAVSNTSWGESTLTFNNRPPLGVQLGSGVAIGTTAQYYEWDVTPFVQNQKNGGATAASFAIQMASPVTFAPDAFNSKEAGSNRPQLVVTADTAGDTPPAVARAAAASPSPVTGSQTALSVLGSDDHGEAALSYTWLTVGTPPAPVTFSDNGTNSAKNTVASFTRAGTYQFQVIIQDGRGQTNTSFVAVSVNPTIAALVVAPASATVATGGSQQFTASARDQFGDPLATQPAVSWSVSGGGSISGSGLFTAGGSAGGPFTVTAGASGVTGTAAVTVVSGAISPEADAYVRDGTSAGSNFGTATTLQVKLQTAGNNRIAYLRFPLASVGSTVGSARLRLFGNRASSSPVTDSAFAVASNSWGETTITFNNRPALGARQGSGIAVDTTARYHEWDVTAFVRAQKTAGATAVSFAVQMDSAVTFGPDTFNSREASASRPQLVVSGGSGADSDGDGLPDAVETGTGVFVSASDTGTDPANPDTDGDGLRDGDEVLGTAGGLDLPAMGTSPVHKDVLLEFDWFDDATECPQHSHRLRSTALDKVVQAFAAAPVSNPDGRSGVKIIGDFGQGGVFTGGNRVADADGIVGGPFFDGEYTQYRAANFAANRQGYFHYVIMGHLYNPGGRSSGLAEIIGDDMIVTLACFFDVDDYIANTIMHELGHNLGLQHGGFDGTNFKPNYNSVMNYAYQFSGVDTDCQLGGDGRLDYSTGGRAALDENALDERLGMCGGVPVDWNFNGAIESSVQADINAGDGVFEVLRDSNDWGGLILDFNHPGFAATKVVSCQPPPPR
jgi:hypothetical protein